MRLKGKVIAITGGAGGLGAAIARGLTNEGATITLIDLPSIPLEELASEVRAMAVVACPSVNLSEDSHGTVKRA